MDVLHLGLAAALLQVSGYLFYGSKVLRRDISPNPVSWLMFAYGTTFLAVIEWDKDASFALLALPIACALSSIAVAFYALREARSWIPEHTADRLSFSFDVLLTVVYMTTWFLLINNIIVESQKDFADTVLLICWNIGIFTAFYPLLRQVYSHPETEHATPWLVWTVAYGILTLATILEEGLLTELILYPAILMAVCGWIAAHTAYYHYRSGTKFL